MPGFGRRYAPDDRDRNFLMRRMLADARSVTLPPRKTWSISSTALNQGNTGTCVGHAWRNFLRCAPIRTERGGPSPFDVYRSAVLKDPWRDNDDEAQLPDGDSGMDSGTTIRAGAEAVTGFGRLKSYVWAFALQPAVEWVLTTGPVVLGTNWYSSFSQPDAEGVVRITASAAGGRRSCVSLARGGYAAGSRALLEFVGRHLGSVRRLQDPVPRPGAADPRGRRGLFRGRAAAPAEGRHAPAGEGVRGGVTTQGEESGPGKDVQPGRASGPRVGDPRRNP